MSTHAVQMSLIPSVSVECKFWLEDSGWNGTAEELSISVRCGSFQEAKAELESCIR